jgi:hypothetical protein
MIIPVVNDRRRSCWFVVDMITGLLKLFGLLAQRVLYAHIQVSLLFMFSFWAGKWQRVFFYVFLTLRKRSHNYIQLRQAKTSKLHNSKVEALCSVSYLLIVRRKPLYVDMMMVLQIVITIVIYWSVKQIFEVLNSERRDAFVCPAWWARHYLE